MMDLYKRMGMTATGFSSEPFVTSWLLPSYALASIRAVLSVYCFTTIFYSWGWFATHEVVFHLQDIDIDPITFTMGADAIGRSFSYFTYLCYWGLAFYFAFASMHTFVYARRQNAWLQNWEQSATWLDDWPLLLQILHSMYYSSIVCLPFLVSSIYWASMWVGPWFDHDFDAWSAVSIHVMNSVFAVFEIVVTQTSPLPWLHLLALLAIMAFYLALAYLTKLTAGVYIYLWLDPQVGAWKIIGHVVGYSMAIVVIFNLVRAAIWLRCRLTRKTSTASVNMLQRVDSNSSSHATLWTKQDFEMQKADSVKLPSRRVSLAPTIPKQSFDVSSIDPSAFPPPEPVYRPYPRRSSSYHVQNFSRPQSVATMMSSSTKHSGFWV